MVRSCNVSKAIKAYDDEKTRQAEEIQKAVKKVYEDAYTVRES
jgi:hypothetical protein